MDPDNIHLPSIYVDRIVVSEDKTKIIEKRTFFQGTEIKMDGSPDEIRKRTKIIKRAV